MDYDEFKSFVDETDCDGCVVCYTGFHPHMLGGDNYAFCKIQENNPDGTLSNKILEIREKQPFTDNKMNEYASSGTYYFPQSYRRHNYHHPTYEDGTLYNTLRIHHNQFHLQNS